jgi:hypothetical protein
VATALWAGLRPPAGAEPEEAEGQGAAAEDETVQPRPGMEFQKYEH